MERSQQSVLTLTVEFEILWLTLGFFFFLPVGLLFGYTAGA